MSMHSVFIYGTLKRGFPSHSAGTENIPSIGHFRTVEAFPLVVGGKWSSPYLIDEPGEGYCIFGEVFEVDDQGLEKLDRMEGTHLPNGYRFADLTNPAITTLACRRGGTIYGEIGKFSRPEWV